MKNNRKILITLVFCVLLCGCSESQSNSNVKTFGKDENTLTKEEASAWIVNENTRTEEELSRTVNERRDNGIEIHERDNLVGEIILENEDNSIEWQVVNNSDIIYNNRTYYNLYKAATLLEMPCSQTTFINFILKTYKTSASELYVMYSSDLESTDDEYEVSTYNEVKDLFGYTDVANKYGEDVYWYINIHERLDKNAATLYGCSKYILYQGSMNEVHIDMAELDTGIVNQDFMINDEVTDEDGEVSENEVEQTDENLENTSEDNNENIEENAENTEENTEENTNEETESNTNN